MKQHNRYRTGDQALVRQINLSIIMQHLREHAPISRATLAEMTGLNKTTVSSLVRELIERQFVHENGLETARPGRPAVLLELDPNAGFIISCEIGVDFVSVICTDFGRDIIWRRKLDTDPASGQQAILDCTLSLLQDAGEAGRPTHGKLLGLAVGVPGLFDQGSGTLLFAPNLGWRDVPLRAILEERFTAPIFVENEANMAALGEHYFGAAQQHDEVLYISVGVGLGGGILHAGRLSSGATGFASEFGHMTMDPDGEQCNCGNTGCWETQVSQQALFRYVRAAVAGGQPSSLFQADDDLERLTVAAVVEAAQAGDEVASQSLEKVGRFLGVGIASLVNALSPELILLGGILSLGGEFLLPVIDEELRRRALLWNRGATRVVLADHGFDACVIGGVAMVYQAILARPGGVVRH